MSERSKLSREIEAHYLEGREAERLAEGRGELERIRTLAIISRHLPPAPAEMLDVGGAAGIYAFPLAALSETFDPGPATALMLASYRAPRTTRGVSR